MRGILPAELDYDTLFWHVSRLPKVVIVTAPRAGSDFFQSLLDGHPEILQVTGQFQFYEFWAEALCKDDLKDLIEEFVWHRAHIGKFKSKYHREERWDLLGEEKNETFEVDIDEFKVHLYALMKGRAITSRNFFLSVHAAYALAAKNVEVERTALLVHHIHEYYHLEWFIKDFDDFDVIYCTRDPRNGIISTVENIMMEHGQMNLEYFRYWLTWIFMDAAQVLPFTNRVKVLPLETLHLKNRAVLEEFCGDFGLEFDESLLRSTYHGKQWWGDVRSKGFLKGFNPSIEAKRWTGKLSWLDVFLLEFLLENRLRSYGYRVSCRTNGVKHLIAVLGILLPMKYEITIGWKDLTAQRTFRRRLVSILKSLFYYTARLWLFYSFYWRKLHRTWERNEVGGMEADASKKPESMAVYRGKQIERKEKEIPADVVCK